MFNLIFLEIRRSSLTTYMKATLIITIISTGLLYLFTMIPQIDPKEADAEMFTTYNGLVSLHCLICLVCFTILSAVIYSKYVIEDYCGNRAILLLSYPVKRNKIFWSKIFVVFSFTVISMIICGSVSLGIFYLTKLFFPLHSDILTIPLIINSFGLIIIYSIMTGALGCISLWVGLMKKSTPSTIVSAVIIVVIFSQLGAISINSTALFSLTLASGLTILALIIALILLSYLTRKICEMEI